MRDHLRLAGDHQRILKLIDLFDPRWDALLGSINARPYQFKRLASDEFLQRIGRHLTGADQGDRVGFRLKRDSDGRNSDEGDGYTRAGCVDIDSHGDGSGVADGMLVRDAFVRRGFDVYMELSKGGRGWHIWAFFEDRVPVTDWRATAAIVIAEAGAPKLEVFPTAGEYGAAPWTPYFCYKTAEATGRTAFLDPFASFRPIPLDWVLVHAVRNPASLLIRGERPKHLAKENHPSLWTEPKPKMRAGVYRRSPGRGGLRRGLPKVVEHGDADHPARNRADGACRAAGMILRAGGTWERFAKWNETHSLPPMDEAELKKVWCSVKKRFEVQQANGGVRVQWQR